MINFYHKNNKEGYNVTEHDYKRFQDVEGLLVQYQYTVEDVIQ